MNFPNSVFYLDRAAEAWWCPVCGAKPGFMCEERVISGLVRPCRPHLLKPEEAELAADMGRFLAKAPAPED